MSAYMGYKPKYGDNDADRDVVCKSSRTAAPIRSKTAHLWYKLHKRCASIMLRV